MDLVYRPAWRHTGGLLRPRGRGIGRSALHRLFDMDPPCRRITYDRQSKKEPDSDPELEVVEE